MTFPQWASLPLLLFPMNSTSVEEPINFYDLICQVGCYCGALVNGSVLLLIIVQMLRQKKTNKLLYWCFVFQCIMDFLSCAIESLDFIKVPYFLKQMAVIHIDLFYLVTSLGTVITALIWKYAFYPGRRTTALLCFFLTLVTLASIIKTTFFPSNHFFTSIDSENILFEEIDVGLIIVYETVATVFYIFPLALDTLVTIWCMWRVLVLPTNHYSASILRIYRKVFSCLIFRVLSTFVNAIMFCSKQVLFMYFNIFVLTWEPILADETVDILDQILQWSKPFHLWLYSLSPLTIVYLMHKLLLKMQLGTVITVTANKSLEMTKSSRKTTFS